VVDNRVLNVTALGTLASPVRVMAKRALITTINSGVNPLVDSDDTATRVKTVVNGKVTDGKATVTYASSLYQPGGTVLPTFNGEGQSAGLAVTFANTGHYAGTINLAPVPPVPGVINWNRPLLGDGEDPSVGATVQPANLTYDVNVLQPRRLRTITNKLDLGNVLLGADIAANFTVTSANQNPSAEATTKVRVAPGGMSLGQLTAAETPVAAGGAVNVPLTGKLTNYGVVSMSAKLPVVTGEDASVQDYSSYKGVSVKYKANVGLAKVGTGTPAFGIGETVLSAKVVAGSSMTNLSSKVNPKGTLAANPTPAASVTGPWSLPTSKLYGTVGSEAMIVSSTPLASDATVTMQWRKRTPGEAHAYGVVDPTLPSECSWLASDVVKIGGIASSVDYALQMSFDNRINLALNMGGSLATDYPGLFLAQYNTTTSHWVKASDMVTAGSYAEKGVFESFSDFLAGAYSAHPTLTLADLLGSWGVDPSTTSTGTGHSWAIVQGSGIFAVDPDPSAAGMIGAVPEPSALVLMISAVAVFLLGYGIMRRR
jgi:hypothetical protein